MGTHGVRGDDEWIVEIAAIGRAGAQRRRDRMLRAEKEVTEVAWKGALAKVRGVPRSCDIPEAGPQHQMPQREGQEDGGVKRNFGNLAIRKL